MAKDTAPAEAKADVAAETKAKAEAQQPTEYVAKGNLLHRMFGKKTPIFAGEPIPKKALEVKIGMNGEDGTLLKHWIDRGIVMLKSDWDKIKAAEAKAAESTKAAPKR